MAAPISANHVPSTARDHLGRGLHTKRGEQAPYFAPLDGPHPEFDDFDLGILDGDATKLSTLSLGERFVYEFDFGDSWMHLCEVAPNRIDPESELGIVPRSPIPYWGWGAIPDQYGRRWIDDDGELSEPPDSSLSDLPPLQPERRPQPRR